MKKRETVPKAARITVKHMDRWLITIEILVCLVFLVVGLAVILLVYPFEGAFRFSMGLLLGGASSVAKIAMLKSSLDKTLGMQSEDAENRGKLYVILRYFVSIAAVVAAILFRNIFGVIGLIAGLLSLQPAALIASRFSMRGDAYDARGVPLRPAQKPDRDTRNPQ